MPPLPDALATLPDDDPEAVLRAVLGYFGRRITLSCSFGGAGGMALLDMAMRIDPGLPVFLLDTDVLFPETYATLDVAERKYGIRVTRLRPALTLEEQARELGPELWSSRPDECCRVRKVEPLRRHLTGDGTPRPFDAWITAIRRDQSDTRQNTRVISWDEQFGLWKICPLAHWDEPRILNYNFNHDVPSNPLLEQGYTSLGCTHCTRKSSSGTARSGRWMGFNKTECGIHSSAASAIPLTVHNAPIP